MNIIRILYLVATVIEISLGCEYQVAFRKKLTEAETLLSKCTDCGSGTTKDIIVSAIRKSNELEIRLLKIEDQINPNVKYQTGCISTTTSGSGLMLTYAPVSSNIKIESMQLLQPSSVPFHVDVDSGRAEAWAPHSLIDSYLNEVRVTLSATTDAGDELIGMLIPGDGTPISASTATPAAAPEKQRDAPAAKTTQPTSKSTPASKKQRSQSAEMHILVSQGVSALVLIGASLCVKKPLCTPTKTVTLLAAIVTLDAILLGTVKASFMHGIPRSAAAIALCLSGWYINKLGQFTPAYLSVLAGFLMWQGNPRY